MKKFLAIAMIIAGVFTVNNAMAQHPEGGQRPQRPQMVNHSDTPEGKQVLELSKQMWQWMADKDATKLANLYHDSAVFVHMGGAWGKEQEVGIIGGGMIHYKHADMHNVSVRFAGEESAIVLSDLDLLAVVGGNEVTNHFMVTENYIKVNGEWKLTVLAFTKLNN